jgi:predicted metal-dependent hydrolase
MSKSSVTELAEKRDLLLGQLAPMQEQLTKMHAMEEELRKIEDELFKEVQKIHVVAVDPVPAKKRTSQRAKSEPVKKRSLKEIVQDILAQHRKGMELKDIVAIVVKMIQAGEYSSKADKLTTVVYQALFALKTEQLVESEKSESQGGGHRTVYKPKAKAA